MTRLIKVLILTLSIFILMIGVLGGVLYIFTYFLSLMNHYYVVALSISLVFLFLFALTTAILWVREESYLKEKKYELKEIEKKIRT